MPAYRNAKTIAASVRSLLCQTFIDFRLIIADDGSPDETVEICQMLANEDSRITFVCNERNLNYGNFGMLLGAANTELFMWAAGDDLWEPDFIEHCVGALDSNLSAVAAIKQVRFTFCGRETGLARGTFGLTGTASLRVARFLAQPYDNSRMYGVLRTAVAKNSFPDKLFHAYDWAFSASMAAKGDFIELAGVGMIRDKTPSHRYSEMAIRDARGAVERIFPIWAMSRWLIFERHVPMTLHVALALLALNIDKHFEVARLMFPKYFVLIGPLARFWDFRARSYFVRFERE